jgi:hypothetical protein
LQLAQVVKAREAMDEMKVVPGINPNLLSGVYALAASPARYTIERNDWMGRDNQDGTVASIRMGLCRGWPDGARA